MLTKVLNAKLDVKFNLLLLNLPLLSFVFISDSALKEYSFVGFIWQYVTIIYCGSKFKRKDLFFVSPVFIILSYLLITYSLGSWALSKGMTLRTHQELDFEQFKHYGLTTFFYMICNVAIFMCYGKHNPGKKKLGKESNSKAYLLLGIGAFCLFSFIDFDLSIIGGGGGSFSNIPRTFATVIIFTYLASNKIKYRVLVYLFVIGVFAVSSFHSKREVIFLVFPLMMLEVLCGNINIFNNIFKLVTTSVIGGVLFLYLIVVMSIARGYGGFQVDGIGDASGYVWEYMQKDIFIKALITNLEAGTSFYHSSKSIEYVMEEPELMTYGSTISKVLFIFIPRDIMPSKPKSFIHKYTHRHDPAFRSLGGSWPPNIIGEVFWNFHVFGFFVLILIIRLFDMMYARIIRYYSDNELFKSTIFIYMYTCILTYMRGSGLDIYIVYSLLCYLFYFIFDVVINSFEILKKNINEN